MAIDLRIATPDDLEAIVAFDFRNFGAVVEDGDVEEVRGELDLDRFLVARDGGRIVGVAGSYQMELTLPGRATVPMSGVTWVSVSASHRRRGIAGRLMAGLDELAIGFDEPVLGLTASEGGIYERFGYGASTRVRVIEIDRRRATLADRWQPEPVELVTAQDHVPALTEHYDRYRRQRVGEVSRPDELHRVLTLDRKKPVFAALHADGYALYEVEARWNDGHPAHLLSVNELVAVTHEAHLALWNLLLSVDLVGPIRSRRALSLDDPLPQLLTDPRAVRTVELNDGLWLKVADPVRCFGARRYRVDDQVTLGLVADVDAVVARAAPIDVVAVGADGATRVDEAPDLLVSRSALGPLLLGASASELAGSRRVHGAPRSIERADALFGTGVVAHCATPF